MLSNVLPVQPLVLTPDAGGSLICLWLPSYGAAIQMRHTLRQLVVLPSCGVETWSADNDPKALFVAWALPGQAQILRDLLSAFGDVIDWPGRLKITGSWIEFGGQPTYADREYEVAAA